MNTLLTPYKVAYISLLLGIFGIGAPSAYAASPIKNVSITQPYSNSTTNTVVTFDLNWNYTDPVVQTPILSLRIDGNWVQSMSNSGMYGATNCVIVGTWCQPYYLPLSYTKVSFNIGNIPLGSHRLDFVIEGHQGNFGLGNGPGQWFIFIYGPSVFTVSAGPPTTSISVSPNPVPYNTNPAFTLSSTNASYCYVYMDATTLVYKGSSTSGDYYPGNLTSVGAHTAFADCYNSSGVDSGWASAPFTVSPAPICIPNCSNASNICSGTLFNSANSCGINDCTGTKNCVVNPAATATIGITPGYSSSIPYNTASSIRVSSTNASTCTLDSTSITPNTTVDIPTGNLMANHNYQFVCTGSGGNSALVAQLITVSPALVVPAPTTSISVSPNPVPYNTNPTFTLWSSNAYYCIVALDGMAVSNYLYQGYNTSGNYFPGAMTSPGLHTAYSYCYNSDWVGSGWAHAIFSVSQPQYLSLCTEFGSTPIATAPATATTLSTINRNHLSITDSENLKVLYDNTPGDCFGTNLTHDPATQWTEQPGNSAFSLSVNGVWEEVAAGDTPGASEQIRVSRGGDTITINYTTIPLSCTPDCSGAPRVCQGKRFDAANSCGTNICTGSRNCDWREGSP